MHNVYGYTKKHVVLLKANSRSVLSIVHFVFGRCERIQYPKWLSYVSYFLSQMLIFRWKLIAPLYNIRDAQFFDFVFEKLFMKFILFLVFFCFHLLSIVYFKTKYQFSNSLVRASVCLFSELLQYWVLYSFVRLSSTAFDHGISNIDCVRFNLIELIVNCMFVHFLINLFCFCFLFTLALQVVNQRRFS